MRKPRVESKKEKNIENHIQMLRLELDAFKAKPWNRSVDDWQKTVDNLNKSIEDSGKDLKQATKDDFED
jgi:hypothetical protein